MRWLSTVLFEAANVCHVQSAIALLIIVLVLALVAVRWVRRCNRQTLILLRGTAFHMIQNRPSTDDPTRLRENLSWWETQVLAILPKAGAKPREIVGFARFGVPGNVYHRAMTAEKIARLDAIIARLEGEA